MPNGDIDGRKPTNLSLGRLRSSKGCGVNPPAFAEKRRHGLDGAETVLRVKGASARFGRDFARHDVATMRSCMSTMSWAKYAAALRIGRAPFLHSTLRSTAQAPECQARRNLARAPYRPEAESFAVMRNTPEATISTDGWSSEVGMVLSITPPVGWHGI